MFVRSSFYTVIVCLFCFFYNIEAAAPAKIKWYSFNEGMALAKKLKLPFVIDFYADWCKWCKVMDRETFSDPQVVKKMQDGFIAIRVDMQNSKQQMTFNNQKFTPQQFSSYLGIQGLPTLVFMDKKGAPVTKIPGFINKEIFIPLLSYMKDECYLKNVQFKDYVDKKNPCK